MTSVIQVGPSPSGDGPSPSQYLTRIELEILRHVANGATNQQIGRRRGTCEDTVKTQMQGILRKLRVDNRAQAVAVAIRLGLFDLSGVTVPAGLPHALNRSPYLEASR